jgi:hypothetical protein
MDTLSDFAFIDNYNEANVNLDNGIFQNIVITDPTDQIIIAPGTFSTIINVPTPVLNQTVNLQPGVATSYFVVSGNVLTSGKLTSVDSNNNLTNTHTSADTATILPTTDITYDLGSALKRWANIFADNFSVSTITVTGLNPSETVVTDASSNITTLPYTNLNTASTIASRDINGDCSFNALSTRTILPQSTGNYNLGSGSLRWDTGDFVTVFTDTLEKRSGDMSINSNFTCKNIIPAIDSTYTLGSSAQKFLTADIATHYGNNINTRSGNLVLSAANNTIQIPGQVWNNRNSTGGATTSNFSQQHYFASSSGGGTALYTGVLTDTLNRGTIQAYNAGGFTGYPLCIQPNTGAASRTIIGDYDATAQANTNKLYVNGTSTLVGITNISDTTDSTTTSTGSIITAGGIGCAKSLFMNGTLNNASTTQSNSTSTGSIITAGGIGVAKNIWCAGTLEVPTINSTGDSLTIGNSTGSLHATTIIGDVTISTSPSTGTISIGNNNSTMTLRGSPININSTGTTDTVIGSTSSGATTINGTILALNTGVDANINIGKNGSATQLVTMYNGRIYFQTSWGTPSLMTGFEEFTFSSSMNGPWLVASNPTYNFYVVRLNATVTITWHTAAQAASAPAAITSVSSLAAKFRPSASSMISVVLIKSNSVNAFGFIEILTTGNITFYSNATGSTFAGAGNAGVFGGSITYDLY